MQIPEFVRQNIAKIKDHNFDAFLVGGCVRDLLMKKTPQDWDIATNARPKQIQKIFPDSKYKNDFGTVLLPTKNSKQKTLSVLEITTYRSERGYSDRRHPDEVVFEDKLDKDLERRDFTINAMAIDIFTKPEKIIDLFGGKKDIKAGIIRAVGEPTDRFKEDGLRLMRAVRFMCVLDFDLEPKTERAMLRMAGSIKFIAKERIRDELIKILSSPNPYDGFVALHRIKILQYIMPELVAGEGVTQDRHHIHSVFKHSLFSLRHCPSKEWQVRLAALLHDVGKPQTKKIIRGVATFYNHEYAGQRIAVKIMRRLKFSTKDTERVSNLVRNHMFYYNVGEVTASSVRRLIRKTGKENLKDLIAVRIADRLGSGAPKAKPYKLRHLEYMMKKVQNDPVSVRQLKINGSELMKGLSLTPGPKIGAILDVLLALVIENPKLNNKKNLLQTARDLSTKELDELRKQAKITIEEKRQAEDEQLKKQHFVK